MSKKMFRLAVIMLGAAGLSLAGCSKEAKGPATVDPHSIDGVLQQLKVHVGLLDEAAKRKDFKYVHDYAYYVKNLAQALYSKLEEPQKQQVKSLFTELLKVTNQLDAYSGRRQEEATLASTQRLFEILKELEAQLKPPKPTATGVAAERFIGG